MLTFLIQQHCIKSVRIRNYSDPTGRTEYGEILRMQKNADQSNSEYGHFSRSEVVLSQRSILFFSLEKLVVLKQIIKEKNIAKMICSIGKFKNKAFRSRSLAAR